MQNNFAGAIFKSPFYFFKIFANFQISFAIVMHLKPFYNTAINHFKNEVLL